jgi:hypothetical protein
MHLRGRRRLTSGSSVQYKYCTPYGYLSGIAFQIPSRLLQHHAFALIYFVSRWPSKFNQVSISRSASHAQLTPCLFSPALSTRLRSTGARLQSIVILQPSSQIQFGILLLSGSDCGLCSVRLPPYLLRSPLPYKTSLFTCLVVRRLSRTDEVFFYEEPRSRGVDCEGSTSPSWQIPRIRIRRTPLCQDLSLRLRRLLSMQESTF